MARVIWTEPALLDLVLLIIELAAAVIRLLDNRWLGADIAEMLGSVVRRRKMSRVKVGAHEASIAVILRLPLVPWAPSITSLLL